jgi:hypothetical protein
VKYVILTTRPGGIARQTAKEQMSAAKRRCGGTAGGMKLTQPDGKGNYIAEFANDQHAAEFVRFCKQANVDHVVVDRLPGNARLKENTDWVALLSDAIGKGEEVRRQRGQTEDPLTEFFRNAGRKPQ